MKKIVSVFVVSLVLSACGSNALIASRATPDELRVIDAPPLTLPPNFELRPPRAGEKKGTLTVREHTQQAEKLILESTQKPQAEKADWLVQQAGGDERDPDIRLKLDVEAEVEEVQEAQQSWFGRVFGDDEKTTEEPAVN